MSTPITLVVFEGGSAGSHAERLIGGLRRAVVLDTLERAAQVPRIRRVVVVTGDAGLAADASARGAEVELDPPAGGPFHFGRRLAQLIATRRIERVIYMSGGLGALATPHDLAWVARELSRREAVVITNNLYSSDLVAFTPAGALSRLEPPEIDNSLALALRDQAGLPVVTPPRTLGLHFDLDTPADMRVLAVHPGVGPAARAYLASHPVDTAPVWAVMARLGDTHADLLLFGRIGAPLFHYLDERTRCRLRVFSEERGMKSLGRDRRGEVVSLMGFLWEATGDRGFFRAVAAASHAALIDSRVLLAHRGWHRVLSQADRFYSDLGTWEAITHPGLREFTRAAGEAGIPVLLGGHSLVSGGMWALVDAAQRGARPPQA